MKLTYFDAPKPVREGSTWYFVQSGFWRSPIRPQRCSRMIPQPGLDAAGKKKRDRMCKNDAKYARWWGGTDPIHQWTDPLCTQHYKTSTSTPKKEK